MLRNIQSSFKGSNHGPITRLISPNNEAGEQLKPFVFLDYFHAEIQAGFGFGMHPHSGIATLTWQPDTDVQYEDTTGQKGVLAAGGLEWMNAGGGAWHQAKLLGAGHASGFQLWVAMPPGVEDGESFGQYVAPSQVAKLNVDGGFVLVLLGELEGNPVSAAEQAQAQARSPINSHHDMNYLVVQLQAGASWRYKPPVRHDVAFTFGFDGTSFIQGKANHKELWTLSGEGDIEIQATNGPVRVLVGSGKKHEHPLVLGASSVHTSEAALARGHARIRTIGTALQLAGRL